MGIKTTYVKGEKIKFNTHNALMTKALYLSAEGYGVAIIGYHDMFEHILTITDLPEEDDG